MTTQATNYKEHHDPRNEACPHNDNPSQACTCKRERKPFRRIRVEDRSVSHGIRPKLCAEVHFNGRLVIREHGRRHTVETTLGTLYRQLLIAEARAAIAEKRAARADRRKQRRLARKIRKG